MDLDMKLQDKYFNMVKNDIKTLEIRLLDKKRKNLCVGDTIRFTNSFSETISVEVMELKVYDNFNELLLTNPASEMGMLDLTFEDSINEFYSIYPKEKCSKYKILAIKFQKNRDTI